MPFDHYPIWLTWKHKKEKFWFNMNSMCLLSKKPEHGRQVQSQVT